jgi:hypothetical protein
MGDEEGIARRGVVGFVANADVEDGAASPNQNRDDTLGSHKQYAAAHCPPEVFLRAIQQLRLGGLCRSQHLQHHRLLSLNQTEHNDRPPFG